MADETTTVEEPKGLNFTEDDIKALEEDFKAPAEDADDELGLDDEDEDEEGEAEEEGEEEEGGEAEGDEGEPGGETAVKEDGEGKTAEGKGKTAEEETEGYELLVDGQQILVDTEAELAAWAQKGIHYEKKDAARQKVVDDATYTMNAMINNPMVSLEEIWTSRYGGNNEQARSHVAKMAEQYLKPIWEEATAEPADRLKLQEDRFTKRAQNIQQQQQQAAQGQFTQEDLQFIQQMDVQIASALDAVDLPKEDQTLRKWMADVMRDGLERGISPDPGAAAEWIKSQQKARGKALGNPVPKKDRKKPGKNASAAKIAQAKSRRSSRQSGGGPAPVKRQRPQFMTTREWLDGLNNDLNLEP
jgi:hypothetical protein